MKDVNKLASCFAAVDGSCIAKRSSARLHPPHLSLHFTFHCTLSFACDSLTCNLSYLSLHITLCRTNLLLFISKSSNRFAQHLSLSPCHLSARAPLAVHFAFSVADVLGQQPSQPHVLDHLGAHERSQRSRQRQPDRVALLCHAAAFNFTLDVHFKPEICELQREHDLFAEREWKVSECSLITSNTHRSFSHGK